MTTFFVGGSQRSGTNLMQTLLCQDSETNPMIHEAQYLRHLMFAYRVAKDGFESNAVHYFGDRESLDDFHRDLLLRLLEKVRSQHGNPPHLVMKYPHLTIFFPELNDLLPDCRFICMLRDPRDTIASMIRVSRKLSKLKVSRNPYAGQSVTQLSHNYLSFYQPLFQHKALAFRKRIMFIRYEDLVQHTDKVLEQLRRFTGLSLGGIDTGSSFDTGKLDYQVASPEWQGWITEHYGQAISAAKVGSYRMELSPEQVQTIEGICRTLMRLFNYSSYR